MIAPSKLLAQEYKIPVENAKTGSLNLEDFKGDLTIEGYNGNEIIINSTSESVNQVPEKAKGLKPVYANGVDNTGLGIGVEKEANQITLTCLLSFNKKGQYKLKVPENMSVKIGNVRSAGSGKRFEWESSDFVDFKTSRKEMDSMKRELGDVQPWTKTIKGKTIKSTGKTLKLSRDTVDGDVFSYGFGPGEFNFGKKNSNYMLQNIYVRNMKNEIEISNLHSINLANVTGPVVLSTVSGNIDVVFSELNKDKPISISSVSGEIDITLPPKSPVDLKMKTVSGTIYSDFDFPANNASMKQIGGSSMKYQLNGGGVDFSIITVSGNIYLRKGK